MDNMLSPEEYQAIEKFANGLKTCFESKGKSDALTQILMKYAQDIIDIHLQLAELEVQRYIQEMAGSYGR